MVNPQSVVLFMEETPDSTGPLMLRDFLAEPILVRMSRQLVAQGIRRFFLVCGPSQAPAARACFPAGTDVTISDQHRDLMEFLNTPDSVLVLSRSAVPAAQAGPGFVYAAPGYELQEAWRERMSHNVQGAELVAGWLPIYGPETIAELEPLLRSGGAEASPGDGRE